MTEIDNSLCADCQKVPHLRKTKFGICESCAERHDYETAVLVLSLEMERFGEVS